MSIVGHFFFSLVSFQLCHVDFPRLEFLICVGISTFHRFLLTSWSVFVVVSLDSLSPVGPSSQAVLGDLVFVGRRIRK